MSTERLRGLRVPKVSVAFDDFGIFIVDDDPSFHYVDVEVTAEEKVWIERSMKKFWAVQDFLVNATRDGQN